MRRAEWVVLAVLYVACIRHDTKTNGAKAQPTALATATPATLAPTPNPTPTINAVSVNDEDVIAPKLLTATQPLYACKGHRVQGSVAVFEALIDESGKVRDIRAIRTPKFDPPCPEFEVSTRAALSKWTYRPAMRNGKPTAVYLTVTVNIQLGPGP